ncbi:MAG TPA: hypothetical protein PLS66_05325 [Tepiditoga sp.]|nr:hypothetical protein [Tepiditoga sp.]
MFALNLFLSHFISDYAFSNVYSEKFLSRENYYKHLIWVVLVFLGISYDFVLSGTFILILLGIGLHVLSDFYRMKKGSTFISETVVMAVFFIISLLSKNLFSGSYITGYFQFYLVGMILATSFLSYIFRLLNIIPRERKDTTGATERLVIYIFATVSPLKIQLTLIAVALGFAYKFFIEKNRSKELFLSPVLGIAISFLWNLIII